MIVQDKATKMMMIDVDRERIPLVAEGDTAILNEGMMMIREGGREARRKAVGLDSLRMTRGSVVVQRTGDTETSDRNHPLQDKWNRPHRAEAESMMVLELQQKGDTEAPRTLGE